MFTLDSPFLLTCSNNEALMCWIPFSPLLLSPVSSCQVGMLCGPFHHLSQAYGEPLTRRLPGTRVSSNTAGGSLTFTSNYPEQHNLLLELRDADQKCVTVQLLH